jgi:YfiR/HmsC-like
MNLQRRSLKKPPALTRDTILARLIRGLPIVPFVFFLVHILVPRTADGQEDFVDEYKLKAAMLYNLTHFVEWPDSAYPGRQAPIFLCILGQDPFASSLTSTLPKETDNGRPVLIRRLQSEKEIPGCHILYISSSERKSAAHIFATLNGSSILTVGEMTQFAAHGGIIQFSMEDQHVRFDINVDAASRAGLRISSKLLALAQIVRN